VAVGGIELGELDRIVAVGLAQDRAVVGIGHRPAGVDAVLLEGGEPAVVAVESFTVEIPVLVE